MQTKNLKSFVKNIKLTYKITKLATLFTTFVLVTPLNTCQRLNQIFTKVRILNYIHILMNANEKDVS